MAGKLRVEGARNGETVEIPQGLDAIIIESEQGGIYIDLGGTVPGAVLVRGIDTGNGKVRLVTSPMESGRLAIGVVKA